MKGYFVPFSSGKPATISVNGHRLVVLSRSAKTISGCLPKLGGDTVKRLQSGETRAEEEQFFKSISDQANAGVVIAPGGVALEVIIENLESELPWIQ